MNDSDIKFDKLQKYVRGDLIAFYWQGSGRLGIVIEENDDVYSVMNAIDKILVLVIDSWLIEKLILSLHRTQEG